MGVSHGHQDNEEISSQTTDIGHKEYCEEWDLQIIEVGESQDDEFR